MRIRTLGALALTLAVVQAHAADFSVTKVRLRQNSSGQGDNSTLRMQGFLVASPPDAFTPANGVTIRVQDAIATDETIVWSSADCVTLSNGKTKCLGGGLKYVKLDVKPLRGIPSAWALTMKVRNLDLQGPFDGPVTVTVTENGSGVDRTGAVADCVLRVSGLSCRAY